MEGPQTPRSVAMLPHPFRRRVTVGGSKSLACRALAAAALSPGESIIHGAGEAADVDVLVRGLRLLGAGIEREEAGIRVRGLVQGGRFPARDVTVDAGPAGFPARLLIALGALADGPVRVVGTDRMSHRPMRPLTEALTERGCPARCVAGEGLPVEIHAGVLRGGVVRLTGSAESSQFLSALLFLLTRAPEASRIQLDGPLVSSSYAVLTVEVAHAFGLRMERCEDGSWRVEPGAGRPASYRVEPDASSAGYAFAAAAMTGGEATVEGLSRASRQPDIAFVTLLERMGCRVGDGPDGLCVRGAPLRGIHADLSEAPDSVPALAAVALFATGPTEIRGVAHLRVKESDRIAALREELAKLGGRLEELPDGLVVYPLVPAGPPPGGLVPAGPPPAGRVPPAPPPAGRVPAGPIDPRGDHRIAMAAALVGLRVGGVAISDPGCVGKSFPRFWDMIGA